VMATTPPPPPPSESPPPSATPTPPAAAPTPPPAPPPAAPAPGGGIGKPRSIGLVILLSIVTLGIWTIVWSYQNGEEYKRFSGQGLGGVAYLFITLLISPVTMFLLANEVEQRYRDQGREPRITTLWGLWFLLPFIGNIIWYVRIQRAINEFWVANGAPADSKGL
ncbi:MAG: DUF4234 domain-containing protein, partial [Cytophagales bacterium]|nr:DUF4234 domain-containing protein [Cytophagales bacterium]